MTSIPAALKLILDERDRDLLDHLDPDKVAAETIEDIVQVLRPGPLMRVSEMTYDEWYSEWKGMLDEALQAQRAVADYAANHGMTVMEEWAEFHRLQRIVDDIHRRRDELTELYQKRVG